MAYLLFGCSGFSSTLIIFWSLSNSIIPKRCGSFTAYPKLVANTSYITDSSALEKVGTTIEVDKISADDVNKIVSYLRPTSMSSDAYNLQEDLINKTQDLAGAGDTANGNVDPEQASGTAILAVQKASQQPLNEQLDVYKQFIEDIAMIWFEMIKTYNTDGITVIDEQTDVASKQTIEIPVKITAEELEELKIHIKIDITPKSAYDKYAQERSLENLLSSGHITFKEYVSMLDDDSTMPKTKLEKLMKQREDEERAMMEMQKQANAINSAMEQVMTGEEEKYGGVQNEMSAVQNSGNASTTSQEQQANTQM